MNQLPNGFVTPWPLRLLMLCLCCGAAAQSEQRQAWALLDRLSEQHSIQAVFVYSSRDQQGAPGTTLQGKVTLQGEQYRLQLDQQEIVCNGTTVWTYLRDVNEVQITESTPDPTASTPWGVLTHYRQDYTFAHLRMIKIDNSVYDVIDMVAKDEQQPLSQFTVTIERDTGHIHTLEVLDREQTWHRFSVVSFASGETLDETFFTFIPEDYRDIEVIDMR
ncbi:MAG: outer membrane lipoprotein carrier protein LolA [Roseivirga sp.]